MSKTLDDAGTKQAIAKQDPPIERGQHWWIYEEKDDEIKVALELRVVGRYFDEYPNGKPAEANGTKYLIMERVGGSVGRHEGSGDFALERLPEYNLRRLFEPRLCGICGYFHPHPKDEGVCGWALNRVLSS